MCLPSTSTYSHSHFIRSTTAASRWCLASTSVSSTASTTPSLYRACRMWTTCHPCTLPFVKLSDVHSGPGIFGSVVNRHLVFPRRCQTLHRYLPYFPDGTQSAFNFVLSTAVKQSTIHAIGEPYLLNELKAITASPRPWPACQCQCPLNDATRMPELRQSPRSSNDVVPIGHVTFRCQGNLHLFTP